MKGVTEDHHSTQVGGQFARVTVSGGGRLAALHVALVTPITKDGKPAESIRGTSCRLSKEALTAIRDAINARLQEPWE